MTTSTAAATNERSSQLLDRLCHGASPPRMRILIIVAHPDDEVIGAGARLRWWRHALSLAHVTEGVPLDLKEARLVGFQTREDYAQARRAELERALSLVGISADRVVQLGFTDQMIVHHLP